MVRVIWSNYVVVSNIISLCGLYSLSNNVTFIINISFNNINYNMLKERLLIED